MRITKRSNIAMRVLMFCAVHQGRTAPITRGEVAERVDVSPSHLAQIINRLSQLGFLATQRGRGGGIALSGHPRDIVIGDVFRAFEPMFPETGCFADADGSCPLHAACRLRPALEAAAAAFFEHLDNMTLDDLVCGNSALEMLFGGAACRGSASRPITGEFRATCH
ncbi:Rrf2 family transcriptional regulator [Roseovarius sp. SCSIO 43702]|uniref:RrF2 family transcriptional regulator n=1 Tax=Roseovarius sp. SCSIO 43702 TaxID=2823043 RepID=UPI001C72B243|nr:Rrf2 family transcriptional regulator [Roseovarius sp. SCSIO 43702]QYX57123.1 Rrf2 family transcriptional regulator [Roseovarius sp. SCSIO 43702]